MGKEVQAEKKKSSIGVTIFVIILLAIFAVGGWFGNDFYRKKVEEGNKKVEKKNTKKDEVEKDEELDPKSELVQKLFKKVTLNGEGTADCHKNWIYGGKDEFDVNSETDTVKTSLVAINLEDSKKQSVSCGSINIPSEQDEYFSNDCSFISPSDNQVYFEKEYVESVFKDVYGKNATLNPDVYILSGGDLVHFYPFDGKYYKYTAIGGNVCGPEGYTEAIERAEKVGKEIKIYESETYNEEGKDPVVTKYVYTFSKQDDGSYGFVSRKKAA